MCIRAKSLQLYLMFATPWTVAHQAPLSMGFSRREYWSGLPFPSPGDLPNPEIEPGSPALQVILYHLSHERSLVPPGTVAKLYSKGDKVIGSLCSQWRSQFPNSFYDSVSSNTTDICQSKRRNVGTTAFLFEVCLILFVPCRIFPSVVVPPFI